MTGVDEGLLSWLPGERARYTSIGGVVTGTAAMAVISMAAALYMVFGGFHILILAVVPVWGLFIFSLDRWLISSTPVSGGAAALFFKLLLPRLLLSVALGVILAEPLLLAIYHTAITEKVQQSRQEEVTTRGSMLAKCNPLPGSGDSADGRECDGFRLPVEGSPEASQNELSALKTQQQQLSRRVTANASALDDLQTKASRECAGEVGDGLTGVRGAGVNCRRLRTEADRLRRDSNIAADTGELQALDRRIADLTAQVGATGNAYAAALQRAIDADLAQVRQRQAEIGILERFAALSELVNENRYVHNTQWAIRIFFVLVDALPVILKVLGGRSYYDRANTDSLGTALFTVSKRFEAARRRAANADQGPEQNPEQGAEKLEIAVRNGIQHALFGPPLANYQGWVNVSVADDTAELDASADGRRIKVGADGRFDLAVDISPNRTDGFSEQVSITDGVDKPQADFTVSVDSDHPDLRRESVPVTIDGRDGSARANFTFDVSDVTFETPPWLWVRVSSHERAIQNIEMTVERPAEVAVER